MGDETLRQARSSVLRLRGLPFQATEVDIEEFFVGYTLKKCQLCKRNGRATGEAYVQLENEILAWKALQELNCKYVGRRYIEIFEAVESDLAASSETKGVVGYVLRLRGLPYSSSRADVESFFDGLEIYKGEENVVFSMTSIGKPTGEAYVEFLTEADQQEAMKKHKQHIGTRYIEIFKSTKADLLQALQQNRFYKEQVQKRQLISQTMIGIPSVRMEGHHGNLTGYEFQVQEVSDVLKGLRMDSNGHNTNTTPGVMLTPGGHYQPTYGNNLNFPTASSHQQAFLNPRYFVPDQSTARPGNLTGSIYPRGAGNLSPGQEGNPSPGVMGRHEVMLNPQTPFVMRSPQHVMQQAPMMFSYRNPTPWMTSNDMSRHPFIPQYPSEDDDGGVHQLHASVYPAAHYHGSNPSISPAGTFPDMFDGEDSIDLVGKSSSSGFTPADQC